MTCPVEPMSAAQVAYALMTFRIRVSISTPVVPFIGHGVEVLAELPDLATACQYIGHGSPSFCA